MAEVEKSYIAEGSSITTYGSDILEEVDVFFVKDLTAGSAALYSAVNATGLPALWSAHPTVPNLRAVSYDVKPAGTMKAFVSVRYVNIMPRLIYRGGCGLRMITTDMDYAKNPLWVTNYKSPDIVDVKSGYIPYQSAKVNVLEPEMTFMVERIRPNIAYPGGIDPVQLSNQFVGKVNSVNIFNTFLRGTLLCENIGYDNEQFGNVAWRIVCEFRYRAKGHQPEIWFTDPQTGLPTDSVKAPGFDKNIPTDMANMANRYGRKVVNWYQYANLLTLIN